MPEKAILPIFVFASLCQASVQGNNLLLLEKTLAFNRRPHSGKATLCTEACLEATKIAWKQW